MTQWYSASMRLLILVEGVGASSENVVVHVFRANDWDTAWRRALDLGRTHETEYQNGDGQRVRWRLERVETLDLVRAADFDGAEVFSAMSDVAGGPGFDAAFNPEQYRPGQTGI